MIEIELYLMKLGIVSWVLSNFTRFQLFAHLWTIVCQVSLTMGFSRQEYWNVLLEEIFPIQGSNLWLLHLLCWRLSTLPLAPIPERGLFSWIVLSGCNDFWPILCCEVLSPQIRSEKNTEVHSQRFWDKISWVWRYTHTHNRRNPSSVDTVETA